MNSFEHLFLLYCCSCIPCLLQVGFTGNYSEYFGYATDVDAVAFLMLVNDMIHGLYPEAVTIGEDVSGTSVYLVLVLT